MYAIFHTHLRFFFWVALPQSILAKIYKETFIRVTILTLDPDLTWKSPKYDLLNPDFSRIESFLTVDVGVYFDWYRWIFFHLKSHKHGKRCVVGRNPLTFVKVNGLNISHQCLISLKLKGLEGWIRTKASETQKSPFLVQRIFLAVLIFVCTQESSLVSHLQ